MHHTEEIVRSPLEPVQQELDGGPCTRCGEDVAAGHRFCGHCGFNLTGSSDPKVGRDPLVGAVVGGRYRLLAKIGSGGMGTVYRVEHVRMGKVMAMKLLHGDLSRDQTMIRRFNREARAVSRLTSPNTVQVFDYGRSDGLVYLVMEYLQGRDLGEVLADLGPLSTKRTAEVIRQIAIALDEAHEKGIVHRDIKPENIFVCAPKNGEEVIKVLDFGLAKLVEGEEVANRTLQGTVIGTPYYMSPEQIMAGEIGPSSDIYSLGALVYKLLTGDPPFNSKTPMAILNQHLTEDLPRLSERFPEHARELRLIEPVVARAMAKEAGARYRSVRELAEDLVRRVNTTEEEQAIAEAAAPGEGQVIVPDKVWLKAAKAIDHVDRISTRADFERYELRMKLGRFFSVFFVVALIAAAAVGVYWGFVEENFFKRDAESEPNDRPLDANLLFVGAGIDGTIGLPNFGTRADVDFYELRYDGKPGDMLEVSVSPVERLDLVLEVHDLDGNLLARSNREGVGAGERLEGVQYKGQPLFASVRELWTEGVPPRPTPDKPYRLSTRVTDWHEDLEREPNNDPDRARPLDLGSPLRGFVSHVDDHDLYVLPVVPMEGQLLAVEVAFPAGSSGRVDLVNGAGQFVRELARADPTGAARAEIFVAPIGPQPLHIDVRGPEDTRFVGSSRPYVIKVEVSTVVGTTKPPQLAPTDTEDLDAQ